MGAFAHDSMHFILDQIEGLKLANRCPAGDDAFLDRIARASDFTSKLTPREVVAWFVARMNFLSGGEVRASFGEHHNDGGSFRLPLTVVEAGKQPIGIFEISGYPARLTLRGGRDERARDPSELLIGALVSEPDWLEDCRLRMIDPDAGRRGVWHCGWEAGQFILG